MDTRVHTPQSVFTLPQRLIVPLFQRPYVWNQENQWEPLWSDVVRGAERLLAQPNVKHEPHFLGAVVLQQVQNPLGSMQERTIIDGQQRLTTLQLLFDALHAELAAANQTPAAMRLEPLVRNAEQYCLCVEDRFKVWPTNRDRPAFNAVMGAAPPINYDAVGFAGERMVEAHRFFAEQAREWLSREGESHLVARAAAAEKVVRELLQIVVIDLGVDENAQEIFETLNARGAQLTAADLIKNYVFQRLMESGAEVESLYDRYWKDFESAFWEAEISSGRMRHSRLSIFLNHWLTARTGEEVVAREVFTRFKRYAADCGKPMSQLLEEIARASCVYREFIEAGKKHSGAIERLGLFAYRTSVLESEVIKPLILFLLDPEAPVVPKLQLTKALDVVESWMVRRMIVRATTQNYNQIVAELISYLRERSRGASGDAIEQFFREQKSDSRYWPDDNQIREGLHELPAYRRLSRGRLRMVLEAIEDCYRGFCDGKDGIGAERVTRGKYAIEHLIPRKWQKHWPLDGTSTEEQREALIHTIGNLTLLAGKLNSKVSNGPWEVKRLGLNNYDVLMLNKGFENSDSPSWSDAQVPPRSDELTKTIIKIWPVPKGHTVESRPIRAVRRRFIELADLIAAQFLAPDAKLYPRQKKHANSIGILLPDGRIDIAGVIYSSPSEAAKAIMGGQMNGWWFFQVDQPAGRISLKDLRLQYFESITSETDEEDADDDDDEEE